MDKKPEKTMSSTRLANLLKQIEAETGIFSSYKISTSFDPEKDTRGMPDLTSAESLKFENKPAQQLLASLNVVAEKNAKLSRLPANQVLSKDTLCDVEIPGFGAKPVKLVITARRLLQLINSAKIYINADIITFGEYGKFLESKTEKTNIPAPWGELWELLACGVCHVQKIDLLTKQGIVNGQAIDLPREGIIDTEKPALILISTSGLDMSYGAGKTLNSEDAQFFLESMYRNIFYAATAENCEYIAMPAIGLGAFGGEPERHFSALMKVARERPQLNIIYNPKQYGERFDEYLNNEQLPNLVKTDKDVKWIAEKLTQKSMHCALLNPSDAAAIYGICDIGTGWKRGTGLAYAAEQHIVSMSTAVLNSRGLNPGAYRSTMTFGLGSPRHDPVLQRRQQCWEVLRLARLMEKEMKDTEILGLLKYDIELTQYYPEVFNGIKNIYIKHVNTSSAKGEKIFHQAVQILSCLLSGDLANAPRNLKFFIEKALLPKAVQHHFSPEILREFASLMPPRSKVTGPDLPPRGTKSGGEKKPELFFKTQETKVKQGVSCHKSGMDNGKDENSRGNDLK